MNPAGGLRGEHWLDGKGEPGGGPAFGAIAAATGEELPPQYRDALPVEVGRAVAAAAAAAETYGALPGHERAALLRRIADGITALGESLLERAGLETALPRARLEAERGRTLLQLRLFADLVEEGSWVDARIDRGEPSRQPAPKPDLRAMLRPLGPVAVFGASNFPFAYSVAGGDTASALAAGCPVVVKGHPAHPGTSELVARAVGAAVAGCGLPAATFALVHGRGHEVGSALVAHPGIAAVGFTGSAQGGRALCDLAAARPLPVPVFAEMGSMNPVFVLPRALAARGAAIADQLAASATLAVGQFCTSPGMVLVGDWPGRAELLARLGDRLAAMPAGTMVHPAIRSGFARAVAEVTALPGVDVGAQGAPGGACPATAAAAMLLVADAATVLEHGRLREEVYGPAVVAVPCRTGDEMLAVARSLHGHLTATVHGTDEDLREHQELIAVLQRKVGRLVFNGVPTGVEVCTAMQHGGPWPASSDSRFTAVGPRAILRWTRPVCWQDAPAPALPPELQDGNPCGIWRTVDGVLTRNAIDGAR